MHPRRKTEGALKASAVKSRMRFHNRGQVFGNDHKTMASKSVLVFLRASVVAIGHSRSPSPRDSTPSMTVRSVHCATLPTAVRAWGLFELSFVISVLKASPFTTHPRAPSCPPSQTHSQPSLPQSPHTGSQRPFSTSLTSPQRLPYPYPRTISRRCPAQS